MVARQLIVNGKYTPPVPNPENNDIIVRAWINFTGKATYS
jgi:hypothetical protein